MKYEKKDERRRNKKNTVEEFSNGVLNGHNNVLLGRM